MRFFLVVFLLLVCAAQGSFAATHFISSQLPEGATLADYGLGPRPQGDASRAVRLVELATLPGAGQIQQIVGRGDALFAVMKDGRIWEYNLFGDREVVPFLDVAALRTNFNDSSNWAPSRGLRGFAFHPDYGQNGLVYTIHKEDSDGSVPDYGTAFYQSDFVLVEWTFNVPSDGLPIFRELFRIRFEHSLHNAQQIGFGPDGFLYLCFGDNGVITDGVSFSGQTREVSDVSDVGQDFDTIQAGVIRIDPQDPSGRTDGELEAEGLKRSANGNFSIPLDNPFVGQPGVKEELFAKGFRNPLSLSFSPGGRPVIADVGEQTVEEINVLVPGGNYGWPNREGTFLVAWADQIDGSPLGADASMRWMPSGRPDDPAMTFFVRDKNQENLTMPTLARSGEYDDGFAYPVFQFTHEGNNTNDQSNGLAGVIGGDYYSGFWAEEMEGLYLFGNISTDQLFFGETAALDSGMENAAVFELPLIDAGGASVELAAIVGGNRGNMRFGKDSYGNLYLASKTNGKLYRFQGTPELNLAAAAIVEEAGGNYFEFTLTRPPADGSLVYELEMTDNLAAPFNVLAEGDYEIVATDPMPDGRERVRFRYLEMVDSEAPRYFRFNWN